MIYHKERGKFIPFEVIFPKRYKQFLYSIDRVIKLFSKRSSDQEFFRVEREEHSRELSI